MKSALLAALCLLAPESVMGQPAPAAFACGPLADLKAAAEASGAPLATLTPEQWQFARAIAVMAPNTPVGLPPGDRALIERQGDTATLFFVDGEQACEPIALHAEFFDRVIVPVGEGVVVHVGDPS